MHHIYCISGLGADSRIFNKIDIHNAELHFINWITPEITDTLPNYAQKISQQIVHNNPILLGVSFGGMLAIEIAKQFKLLGKPVSKTIIVSSCKNRNELPIYFRAVGRLRLHKIIPFKILRHASPLTKLVFGLQGSEQELYLKEIMMQKTNPLFLKRCINMILNWKYDQTPENVIHIHGTKDLLLPINKRMNCHKIEKGTHFLIWNQSNKVNTILNNLLIQID